MRNKSLISRYNVATNRFEIGYWSGRNFIVVQTVKAA